MLKALEAEGHCVRLRDLCQRFRASEMAMTAVLNEMQDELEFWHREASYQQLTASPSAATWRQRCVELQAECDVLATELVHVRLAVSGAMEELAAYEDGDSRISA